MNTPIITLELRWGSFLCLILNSELYSFSNSAAMALSSILEQQQKKTYKNVITELYSESTNADRKDGAGLSITKFRFEMYVCNAIENRNNSSKFVSQVLTST